MSSKKGHRLIEIIREKVVIGDGAMGTELWRRGYPQTLLAEKASLDAPELVTAIHRDYLHAGAQVLTTNTFGLHPLRLKPFGLEEQVEELVRAAVRLAKEVGGEAKQEVWIAGSVGPLGRLRDQLEVSDEEKEEGYRRLIHALAEAGVDVILFETFLDISELTRLIRLAKRMTDLPVIAQLAALDSGPRGAESRADRVVAEWSAIGLDAIGTNCGVSPERNLELIKALSTRTDKPLCAFPNIGYAQYVDGRFVYLGDIDGFVKVGQELYQAGASLLGGCCGTTPEHIRALAQHLHGKPVAARRLIAETVPAEGPPPLVSPMPNFLDRLWKEPIVIVELDPPRNLDYQSIIEGSRILKEAGCDAISLGDNSLASVRISNMVMAYLIQEEVGIPTICHFSCRDHNLIGTQSLLMGMAVLGIPAILAVTGDPARLAPDLGASSVYDLNSFQLMELISRMNQGKNWVDAPLQRRTRFLIGAGFNPNVRHISAEVKRLKKKVERGAQFALTQCVFNAERIRLCRSVMEEVGIPIFVGIGILISARNAAFWKTVPGVVMDDQVLDRMEKAPPDRQRAEGLAIAKELTEVALEECPGVFLVPPFSRADYALPIVQFVRSRTWSRFAAASPEMAPRP
ncbi:MAG: bifunctional homocysteine S-methyltransferase/methylenetetrahydrofolate reductase [Armatimonadetes bacterium]|nr:bifunctional homocysteine S-methyltransferase/methylenetetrahydrofolate reductase [Armatimonadota bacterium]MDW8121754.1 bifunctional homocysteine S-methyltransferase/methylenetetrahydrofolate reductase [Armatimonadota bacterium]